MSQRSPAPSPVDSRQHALGQLMNAQSRVAKLLRGGLIALGLAVGLGSLGLRLTTLLPPQVYQKDILQEYLLARAIRDGTDPYLLAGTLAERYLGFVPTAVFVDHPIPHPPPAGMLFLPFSLLDYPMAAVAWLGLEIVCLVASVYLLGRAVGVRLAALSAVVIATTLLALYPFAEDLEDGQLMLVLLALLAGAWLALLSGRRILGGVLVGIAILIKPVPWPLLLLFAQRRDWRALGTSVATILLGYAIASWMVGLGRVVRYFSEVLPKESETYRAVVSNLSVWSFGWRAFDGTGPTASGSVVLSGLYGVTAPPLVSSATAALITSTGLAALVLASAYLGVRRVRGLSASLGLMICASILISPVSWGHYLVLAAIPVAQVIRWLIQHGLPARETNMALVVALLLLLSFREWARLALLITGQTPLASGQLVAPFAAALLTLMPAVAVGALGWLVFRWLHRGGAPAAEARGSCR